MHFQKMMNRMPERVLHVLLVSKYRAFKKIIRKSVIIYSTPCTFSSTNNFEIYHKFSECSYQARIGSLNKTLSLGIDFFVDEIEKYQLKKWQK